MAEISGRKVWGRMRLGRMDGVKMALGSRGMTERQEGVESLGAYVGN